MTDRRRKTDVLGSLPHSRPHRRSEKRGARAERAAAPAPDRAPARPPRAAAPPAKPPARAEPQPPDRGALGTAAQVAAELTEIGLAIGARALRQAISRLPRP
jgi:hypothetical protein